MCCRILYRVGGIVLFVFVVGLTAEGKSTPPTVAELFQSEQIFKPSDAARVGRGEVVETEIVSLPNGELAGGVACLATSRQTQAYGIARSGNWLVVDRQQIASGPIAGQGTLDDFSGISFEPGHLDNASRFLDPKTSGEINLSSEERARFAALKRETTPAATAAMVASELRRVLLDRYRAYLDRGLEGIVPYVRGSKTIHAGKLLRESLEHAKTFRKHFPRAYQALLGYPRVVDPTADESFHWAALSFGDKLTFVLIHRYGNEENDRYAVVQRIYYATEGIESAMVSLVLVPVREGTLIVYGSRLWTDRITGLGESLKRGLAKQLLLREKKDVISQLGVCRS